MNDTIRKDTIEPSRLVVMTAEAAREHIDDVMAERPGRGYISAWIDDETETGGNISATLRIYGPIGGWFGVDAEYFAYTLDELGDVDEIEVAINSGGGSAFEGIAIYNLLRAHPARITTRVDGLAASAASIIAQAGDDRVVMTGAQLMIHDPWMATVGDAAELRRSADQLDRMSDQLAEIYAERAGGDVHDWAAAMANETWYGAAEAVEFGLADRAGTGTISDDSDGLEPAGDATADDAEADQTDAGTAGAEDSAPTPDLVAERREAARRERILELLAD